MSGAVRSTQTPRLGLNKPDPGGDVDTWGDEINANADILDNALLAIEAESLYLPIDGGEMAGPLTLAGDPTAALQAATKRYVDGAAPAGGPYLPIGGGVLTGALTLAGAPTQPLHAATRAYVDAAPPAGGPYLPIGGGVLTGALTLAGAPTQPLHAANREYVDAAQPAGGPYLPLSGGDHTGPLLAAGGHPHVNRSSAVLSPVLAGSMVQIVSASGGNPKLTFDAYGGNPIVAGRSSNGTPAAPAATPQDRTLMGFNAYGYGSTLFGPVVGQFAIKAAQAFTDTAQGTYMAFFTAAMNTTAVAERMRLDDSGALLIGLTARTGGGKLQVMGGGLLDVLTLGTVAGPTFTPCVGAPTFAAPAGSVAIRSDGTPGARVYVNQNGAGSWLPIAGV